MKIGRQLFALPELKASQKFSVHVHVERPQAQLRELKVAKDRRYKLKEGNSKLKSCGKYVAYSYHVIKYLPVIH